MPTRRLPSRKKGPVNETKSPLDNATIKSPEIFIRLGVGPRAPCPLRTALLRLSSSSSGIISFVKVTGPRRKALPISESCWFQKSTASITSWFLGSPSLPDTTTVGVLVQPAARFGKQGGRGSPVLEA